MRGVLRTILMLTLLLTACTLNAEPPTPTPTVEPTDGSAFIDARDPTAAASATPQAPATTAPTPVRLANCNIRTDWFIYIVYPGETLSRIAQRSGTTTAILASANCLANPNLIFAGQALRVPVLLPPPATLTPTTPSTGTSGSVVPSPFVRIVNGQYELVPDTTVNLSWAVNASGFTRVEFYAGASLIGTDTFFGDGVGVNFLVPRNLVANLSAIAYQGNNVVRRTAQDTAVFAQQSPPVIGGGTALTVAPYADFNNNTFVLQTGVDVTFAWNATFPAQTQRVDFILTPPGGGAAVTMGTDTNLADGAQIVWNVPEGASGTVTAVAAFSGGFPSQSSDSYFIVTQEEVNAPP